MRLQRRQRLLAAALMLVSAGMAAAYGPMGVRVNAVNPGATHTERLQSGMQATARMLNISEEEALAQATRKVPLARIFHRSRATNEDGIALVCPKIQVSNLDQRAGNAEAKLYRRN